MDRSRKRAAFRVPPFLFIAVAFFLPFVRSCGTVETPIGRLQPSPDVLSSGIWVLPPFLAAAGLAVLLTVALLRPAWRDQAALAGVFGLVAWVISVPLLCVQMMVSGPSRDDLVISLWSLAATLPAAGGAYLSAIRPGWRRFDWLTVTYVLLAIGSPVTFLLGAGEKLLYGGWIYVFSLGALLILGVEALLAGRRRQD
jgi:hypothetical protein